MATVTLTWSPPASGSGGPVSSYTVHRKQSSSTLTAAQIISAPDKTFTNVNSGFADSDLSSGSGQVWYTVTAVNSGGESAGAGPVSETL